MSKGCRVSFDKTDTNYIFQKGIGQSCMEKVRPQINNIKKVKKKKKTRTTGQKEDAYSVADHIQTYKKLK